MSKGILSWWVGCTWPLLVFSRWASEGLLPHADLVPRGAIFLKSKIDISSFRTKTRHQGSSSTKPSLRLAWRNWSTFQILYRNSYKWSWMFVGMAFQTQNIPKSPWLHRKSCKDKRQKAWSSTAQRQFAWNWCHDMVTIAAPDGHHVTLVRSIHSTSWQ